LISYVQVEKSRTCTPRWSPAGLWAGRYPECGADTQASQRGRVSDGNKDQCVWGTNECLEECVKVALNMVSHALCVVSSRTFHMTNAAAARNTLFASKLVQLDARDMSLDRQ
jgi:hypothetical protein